MSTDAPEDLFSEDDGVLYAEEVAPQHGVLGFTLRELLIVAAWLVMFVTSFFPLGWAPALWSWGIAWILPLGIPTAAVFLIVLRRFSPDGIRRVGSLGIDQFASVAFSVAAVWWFQTIWDYLTVLFQNGLAAVVWVPWVQLAAVLALVAFTVFGPIIPGLRDDFRGRLVTLAHRNANPVRPVIARPRPERPAAPDDVETADAADDEPVASEPVASEIADAENVAVETPNDHTVDETTHDATVQSEFAESVPLTSHASGGELGTTPELGDDYVPGYVRSSREGADEESAEAAPFQPFWALAPTPRDIVDERGDAVFQIGPDAWALVVEERDGAFVVRHDDGRIGYLHDTADLTRG